MPCARCPSEGARPSLMNTIWRRFVQPSCAAPLNKDLAPNCGRSSAWVLSSNACTAFAGQTQVWRILGALGFNPQNPEKRAIERNEDTVLSWKRSTWPALKKIYGPPLFCKTDF